MPYELVSVIIEQMLPRFEDAFYELFFLQVLMILKFLHLYFSWWSSFIACLLCMVIQTVGRSIFTVDEPLNQENITIVIIYSLIFSLALFIVHLVVTKTGYLYIETEILREGNESLLNNLEEGVIIFEEETL